MTSRTSAFRCRTAALAVAVAAPVLAGCSLGFDAPTDQVYQPSRGTNDRSGTVDVLGAVVVSGADGAGTVSATLVNGGDEPDTLTGITVDGTSATIDSAAGVTELKPSSAVNLATSGAVTVSSDAVVAGDFVELTFTFEDAEPVKLDAPVVPNTGDFADVTVPEAG